MKNENTRMYISMNFGHVTHEIHNEDRSFVRPKWNCQGFLIKDTSLARTSLVIHEDTSFSRPSRIVKGFPWKLEACEAGA